jgi:sulfur relay (sulfurtransferase) DsrC/TusE family protein
MNQLIENMLNRPTEIKVGQIWWNYELKRELVISDTRFIKQENIVRTMLIGSSSLYNNIAEEFDINIPQGETVLPSDRTIFVLTSGPNSIQQLDVFVGNLSKNLTEKVIYAEKNYVQIFNSRKNSEQTYILRHEYAKLSKLRIEAIRLKEKSKIPFIYTLSQTNNIEQDKSNYMVNDSLESYNLAAEDKISKNEKIELSDDFWELEMINSPKAMVFIKSEKLEVRLNEINNILYLVFNTSLDKKIKNIIFSFNNRSSQAKDLVIKNKGAAFPLAEIIKEKGIYNLSFDIGKEKYSFDFEIK